MNTTLNYSPNFDKKKRNLGDIKFIIFHYTGMKRENYAINRLTSFNSKVSSHYFIKKNGEILTLVPDLYTAWHAGVSSWKSFKSLNKYLPDITIERIDERYTSKISKKIIDQMNSKKKIRMDKSVIDKISASLILESYLIKMSR